MRIIENESDEIRQLEEEMIGIKIISAGAGKKGCARETNGPARWKNAFARRKMEMQVGKMHLQEEKWRCSRKNAFARRKMEMQSEKCICSDLK